MAENTRASRLAIVREVTEGVPVDVTLGTQFIPLQPGFEFVPNVETLENDEIRASIGSGKPIQGNESPTASFSEYLKHSGVEGQAPNWGALLHNGLGSTSSNATERLTAAASTTTLIKMAAGGADMARGKAFLGKDGVNGFWIRPVDSMAGNDATLGFALPNAPAAGVGLGKCVNYTPADSGHPTDALHLYRGNGGAKEVIAGARVSELSMSVDVGQIINMEFSLQGTGFYMNPVRIGATNKYIDFEDTAGVEVASIPEKLYKTPHEVAAAIQAAMNSVSDDEFTVVFNDRGANAGKFTFTSDGTTFELLWNTGANAANSIGTTLGFLVAADDAGVLTYTSDNAQSYAAAQTPAFDAADPMVAKNMEVLVGDQNNYEELCLQTFNLTVTNTLQQLRCIGAESGVEGSVVSQRATEITIVAQLARHDVDKFNRFINNSDTKFLFNFGQKAGGNWVAGKCGCVYVPSCTIAAYQHGDDDGLVTMEYTLRPFVDASGNPEIYINFL